MVVHAESASEIPRVDRRVADVVADHVVDCDVTAPGLHDPVKDIRLVEVSLGDPNKRLMEREIPVMQKLRRIGA